MELKTKVITLSCIILISLLSSASAANKCPSITDVKATDGTTLNCVQSSGTPPDGIVQIFQACPAKKFCPFNKYSQNTTTNVVCEDASNNLSKNYPGLPCAANTDCIDGATCTNNVCVGIADGSACERSSQCQLGSACGVPSTNNTRICVKQTNIGHCTENYQCLNTHGCNNGTCTEYFSLDNGAKVDSQVIDGLSLCKSGQHDSNYTCIATTLKNNTNPNCTDDATTCTYTVDNGSNATDLSLNDTCNCPYTIDTTKRCKFGSTDTFNTNYITKVKDALVNLTKCHGAERKFACNAYNGIVQENEFNTIIDLYVIDWLRNNGHKVQGLNEAQRRNLVNVTLTPYANKMTTQDGPHPNNTNTTSGIAHICPIFKCESGNGTTCASIIRNETNNTSSVTLYDVCNSLNETCNVDSLLFTKEFTGTYSCAAKSAFSNNYQAYAGEQCQGTGKGNCFGDLTCDGKCKGKSTGDNCTQHQECNVGNYCDDGTKKCAAQKSSGSNCTTSYECNNNLMCNAGNCTALFSLEVGAPITNITEDINRSYLCKSGRANKDKTVCVTRTYTNTSITDMIECLPGSACNYIESAGADKNTTVSNVCLCGFNKDGKAYCPVPDNASKFKFLIFRNF